MKAHTELAPYVSVGMGERVNAHIAMATDYEQLPRAAREFIAKNRKLRTMASEGKPFCIVAAEPQAHRAVKCEVKSGKLNIYAEKFKYKTNKTIDIYVLCDSTLREIRGTKASNIYTRGCLRTKQLRIVAEAYMTVHVTAHSESVRVDARKESTVWLTGNVGSVKARVTEMSKFRMCQIVAQSTEVTAESSSYAEVCAEKRISMTATGNSQISYYAPEAATETYPEEGSRIYSEKITGNLVIERGIIQP